MRSDDLPQPGATIELLCVKGSWDGFRARFPPDGPTVIVRTGLSKIHPVEGELFTIEVDKSWIFGHTLYVKGMITSAWFDLARLELPPLRLTSMGSRDPVEEEWSEHLPEEIATEILRAGCRDAFEMEQILPENAVELRFEDDPIVEAAELSAAGEDGEAAELLGELLSADLRCVDAHAHLGNIEMRSRWPGAVDRAARHYRIGVAIGDAALGEDFRGALPWGLIDNRPFLRCLHGLGLSCWRAGDHTAALPIFRRLMWLNPDDNQGARFLWPEVQAGKPWDETE